MAQNKNTKKPESVCQKIQNAVSPFRARTFRVSHQPQRSISINSDKKPPSPRTGPACVLHQPSLSKMIPVEIEPRQVIAEREVTIVKSSKLSKLSQPADKGDEDRFSDYITKVKDRMMKTSSNASGGGGGDQISSIKDSFNDKVTNYITRTKIKVRKTTSVGGDKSFSFLK